MLDLRRLRLLRELHERGTIAAVADALQFTPSAVSQQLAMLEREAGVPLLERAGPRRAPDRRRRSCWSSTPTRCSSAPRCAEADLAAAAGTVAGRGAHRRASSPSRCSSRCRRWRRSRARRRGLRCELIEAEPEQALPALALGDVDLVLGDEWQHQPRRLPRGPGAPRPAAATRSTSCCPARHPAARRHPDAVPLAELAGEAWTTGHAGHGLGRDDAAHLPRARRLRARRPPPHQRRRRSASRSSPAAWPSTMLPDLAAARRVGRASTLRAIAERPDRTARSSPPPARPTRRGRRRRRCSRQCGTPSRRYAGATARLRECPPACSGAARRSPRRSVRAPGPVPSWSGPRSARRRPASAPRVPRSRGG